MISIGLGVAIESDNPQHMVICGPDNVRIGVAPGNIEEFARAVNMIVREFKGKEKP